MSNPRLIERAAKRLYMQNSETGPLHDKLKGNHGINPIDQRNLKTLVYFFAALPHLAHQPRAKSPVSGILPLTQVKFFKVNHFKTTRIRNESTLPHLFLQIALSDFIKYKQRVIFNPALRRVTRTSGLKTKQWRSPLYASIISLWAFRQCIDGGFCKLKRDYRRRAHCRREKCYPADRIYLLILAKHTIVWLTIEQPLHNTLYKS